MAKGGGKSYIALNLEGFDELLKKKLRMLVVR